MDAFSVEENALNKIEFISQRQGEETKIDPFSQSTLKERRHNDDARRINQKQQG